MQITVTPSGQVYVARLQGVLDEDSQPQFQELLHPLVAEGGNRIVVDLTEVPRLTSMGLGQLVTLVARANTKGSTVILASPVAFVRSVLAVSRLDQFFDLADSVDEALARLA